MLVVSVQIAVQLPDEAVRYSIVTLATPLPPSVAVAVSALVPVTGVPGSVSAVAGAVLSTRRLVTVALVCE